MRDDDDPEWRAPEEQQEEDGDDWLMASYDDIELRLRTNLKQKNVHAVDMVTIGTKEDPIPMKDVDDERILSLSDGKYCGQLYRTGAKE